jgi:predicted nucleic acid-binding protein
MILLDTNIILRSKQKDSPHYKEVTDKLIELLKNGESLAICPQVIYEFYVVATRPITQNGLGLASEIAAKEIDNIEAAYELPYENEMVFKFWQKIVRDYKIEGKKAHDARIVAFMLAYGIKKLYTLNKSDFERFNTIIDLI